MSELSQKKTRASSEEDTISDSPPVVAKADPVKADKADKVEKTEKLDKPEKAEKAEKTEKAEKKADKVDAAKPNAKADGASKKNLDLDTTDPDQLAVTVDSIEPANDKHALEVTVTDDAPVSAKPPKATKAEPGPIVLRVFGRTDVGQVREHNEDNFVVADLTKASRGLMEHDRLQTVGERGTVLGVCDGMGGAAAGEVASQLAVDIIYQRMLSGDPPTTRDDVATRLVGAIEAAGMRIFAEAKADRSRRGMGTTSTIAALIDDYLFFGQVGDSRAYLLRGDRLVQVTRDQSLVNQLIEAGQLTEEEAETFEHNNIILQALGTAESVQVDLTYVDLRRGDTLLLCSDGLSGMVRNDEIREVLRSFDEPLEACRELTDRANLAGGHDNVTVVVAKFEGEGLRDATPEDVADLKYRKYELPELSNRSGDLASGQIRTSLRPGRPNTHSPEIEVGYDEYDSEYPDSESYRSEDPVEIPREQAPSWIVTMMIVSAVTCVVVAGYYLLR